MTKKKIWFGNAEKMMWVNCPSTNIRRGRGKWEESGTYLNGGAYQKSSAYSHRKYSIDWNLMESYEAAKIMSYYEGVYGQSPIHFVDPFAAKSNILPLHWSTPRLCAEGEAPSLAGVAETAGGSASLLEGAPTKGAFFPLIGSDGPSVTIPVPPGQNLYIGAQGGESTVLRTNQAQNPTPSPNYVQTPYEISSNLIINPSFELNQNVSSVGTNVTVARVSSSRPEKIGNYMLSATFNNTAANQGYVGQFVSVPTSAEGKWFGFSALVGRSTGDAQQSRVVAAFYNGNTFITQANSPIIPLRNANLDRVAAVGQIPVGTTQVRCYVWFYGSSTSVGVTTGACFSDGWIATYKDSEAEAADAVSDAKYFDGSGGAGVFPGMTAAWTGAAHASSSTLTGVLPRGWYNPGTSGYAWMNGYTLEVRSKAGASAAGTYVDPLLSTQPTAGQWVAMGVDIKPHNSHTVNTMRLRIAPYNGATMTGTTEYTPPNLSAGRWTRAVHARQVTDAGTGPTAVRFLVWPTVPSDGQAFAVRAYTVAYAATEAEARAMVETSFSGDLPNESGGKHYQWDGTPGLSSSTESAGAVRSVPAGSGLKVKDSSGVVRSVPYSNGKATSLTLVDPGTCEVYYTGGFLSGAVATIGTEPPRQDIFRPGEGNTGLRFVGEPTRTGYSSVLDLESVSAEFVEVGAWE